MTAAVIRIHKETGLTSWFGNVTSAWGRSTHHGATEAPFRGDDGSYHPPPQYGDGEQIEKEYLDLALKLAESSEVLVSWEKGDLVLLDVSGPLRSACRNLAAVPLTLSPELRGHALAPRVERRETGPGGAVGPGRQGRRLCRGQGDPQGHSAAASAGGGVRGELSMTRPDTDTGGVSRVACRVGITWPSSFAGGSLDVAIQPPGCEWRQG